MAELVPGTLEMLILKTLTRGPMHGYRIAQVIGDASEDVLRVEEGSLYPALQRLEQRGWVRSEWGLSEHHRRARYYRLTAKGRRSLEREMSRWTRLVHAIRRVMRPRTTAK